MISCPAPDFMAGLLAASMFRRFGVVSAFFCEIANRNAVCFGVSALGVSLAEAVLGQLVLAVTQPSISDKARLDSIRYNEYCHYQHEESHSAVQKTDAFSRGIRIPGVAAHHRHVVPRSGSDSQDRGSLGDTVQRASN